mmetsp:Transcript_21451/g.31880  ORF Transcript_21451/g.31880 Transcript_21451/m.31880 type:complete len:153 (-) Transcript_21451:137-595(-)
MPSLKVICNKRVHFAPQIRVIVIGRYEEIMTDYERTMLWYTNRDKTKIIHSVQKTIKMVQRSNITFKRCIRGIEHLACPELFEQIKINKDCVHFGVLREQHRQQMLGIRDVEEMRKVSSVASQWARKKAFELGIKDTMKAQKRNTMTCSNAL